MLWINGDRLMHLNYNKTWYSGSLDILEFLNTQTNKKTYREHLLHVLSAGSACIVLCWLLYMHDLWFLVHPGEDNIILRFTIIIGIIHNPNNQVICMHSNNLIKLFSTIIIIKGKINVINLLKQFW